MATVHIAIGSMYTNAKVRNWQSYGFVIDIGMIQMKGLTLDLEILYHIISLIPRSYYRF